MGIIVYLKKTIEFIGLHNWEVKIFIKFRE